MPGLYVKNANGDWVLTTHQYAKYQSTGWKRATEVHQKTGAAVWTERIVYDDGPPSQPTLTTVMDASAKTLTSTITMPSDSDVVGAVLKLSSTGWPVNPESSSDMHVRLQTDGQPYSQITAGPNAVKTRVAINATAGVRYYMRCWTKDANGNYSTTPASWDGVFPYPAAPNPTLVTKTAYVTTTASGSWNRNGSYWRSDNNYVYQGGPNNPDGRWYYGGKIKSLLTKAVEIKYVKIYVKRHTSAHGVSGDANIKIGTHGQTTKPSGAPVALNNINNFFDLTRGEGIHYTLPSTWYQYFKNGTFAGLGTYAGTTTVTSADYAYLYGYGTDSGRLEIQWTEYA